MKKYISLDELLAHYYNGKKICVWGAGYLAKTTCKDVLEKLKIKPSCFCDNNRELIGQIIYDDIKCVDYSEIVSDCSDIVVIINVRIALQDEVYEQISTLGFNYIIPITDISGDERIIRDYFPFLNEKTVAYTCVVNDYDKMHFPKDSVADMYDFYYISDKKPKDLGNYKGWIDVREVCPEEIRDYTRINRYCKINAHKIFGEYGRSVYFDGNVEIKGDFESAFQLMNETGLIVLKTTGHRDVYEEASHKISQKVDNAKIIYKQMEKYWGEGFPRNFGSWFCTVLLRRHNTIKCKKIMEDWWDEVISFSKRDQLSLPYVLWKNGYASSDIVTILGNDENTENNHYLRFCPDHLRKI